MASPRPSNFPVYRPLVLPDPAPRGRPPVASPPARILLVTPEIAAIPPQLSPRAHRLSAKAGGLADVSASLLKGLEDCGARAHLAIPNYRQIFGSDAERSFKAALTEAARPDAEQRLHLVEDRVFYYRSHIYGGPEAHLAAIAYQREVINNIITRVRPDLIHCQDWMTGLIPAAAKQHGIPCLFTVHNIHTERLTLGLIEDRGIDTANFWQHLFYNHQPDSYEETRGSNPCDFLASGIAAADHVTIVSPNFLSEILHGYHDCVPLAVRAALREKAEAGYASGITNAPDATYNPTTDPHLRLNYGPANVEEGKTANKVSFQRRLGLDIDPDAPLLFWPSRLDPLQKGCQLLTDLLFRTIEDYDHLGLQIVAVANGPYECHLHHIIGHHRLERKVASVDFDESLSRCGFAGSDFVLMPSSFEPCGLPQMIGAKYGSIPIARNTGGLCDTIQPLDPDHDCGNGFLFDHFSSDDFRDAIDRALAFYQRPLEERTHQLRRIMTQASRRFSDKVMNSRYFDLYERLLERPLTSPADSDSSQQSFTSPLPVSRPASHPRRNGSEVSVAV